MLQRRRQRPKVHPLVVRARHNTAEQVIHGIRVNLADRVRRVLCAVSRLERVFKVLCRAEKVVCGLEEIRVAILTGIHRIRTVLVVSS